MASRRLSNLALFSGQFGLSLMQTLFMFYYVKVFLNVFHVNVYWFNIAQVFFLIWNAINDPLFGYIQDISGTWMKDRSKIFSFFGPALSVSFLILWFPWKNAKSMPYVEGIHLIVALFLYDAFYSCVGVAWGALFTESTRDHRRRVQALKYSQLAILCSVGNDTFNAFQYFKVFQSICVIAALISAACFYVTGKLGSLSSHGKQKLLEEEDGLEERSGLTWRQIVQLTGELLKAKDFQRIVLCNFIHTMRAVSHMNFASIATDLLIPQSVLRKGSWQISVFFSLCTLIPQVLLISNEAMLVRAGAYRMMMLSFFLSILSSSLYILSWSPYVIMFFMLVDSVLVHATAPLFNILLAEFIEDDTQRNARKSRMSSLIFALNAFVMKPAISVAPVLIVHFLNNNGYEHYQKQHIGTEPLALCMLRIIFLIPVVLGAAQALVFRSYSLRNKHMIPALPV